MLRSIPPTCTAHPGIAETNGLPRLERRQRMKVLSYSNDAPASEFAAEPDAEEVTGARPVWPNPLSLGNGPAISLSVCRYDNRQDVKTYDFQQPLVLIGSCPTADLVLPDPQLDLMHVYLQHIEGRWVAIDLSAISGCHSDEKGKPTAQWFDPECELRARGFSISHVAPQSKSSSTASSPVAAPFCNQSALVLDFLNGRGRAQGGLSHQITGPITLLGNSRLCDLWLRDSSVAEVHASLVRTRHGLWVADLCRNQNVLLNDSPECWAQLDDGSLLQIGKFRFRIQNGGSRGQMAAGFKNYRNDAAPRALPSRSSSPHGLSEEGVLALVRQFSEMQNRFVESAQVQMQLMSVMLQQFGAVQPSPSDRSVRRGDVKQLLVTMGRELNAITKSLDGSSLKKPVNGQRRSPRGSKDVSGAPVAGAAERASIVSTITGNEGAATMPDTVPFKAKDPSVDHRSAVRAAPRVLQSLESKARGFSDAVPPATNVAQDRLTERMANFACARKGLWHRVWRMFD
jgi:hypothetical protein